MKRITQIHNFVGHRMNLDSADELLKENETRAVWNSIANIPGSIGKIKKLKGFENVLALPINSDISFPQGATFTCIGSGHDLKAETMVYMLCDTSGTAHSILRMFTFNKKCEWVDKNDPTLNFKVNSKIKKLNFEEDLMYWTDGYEGIPFVDYNPPRKLNQVKATAMTNPWDASRKYYKGMIVQRFNKSYRATADIVPAPPYLGPPNAPWELANIGVYSAITFQILDRIKWAPAFAPGPSYDNDPYFPNNLLRNKLFQFAYWYVMDDNEKTVPSPISIIPLPTSPELQNGVYLETSSVDNVIHVWVNSGPPEVKEIDIAVREGNHGVWKLIKRWYKYDQDGNLVGMLNNINIVYLFHNNEVGEVLSQDDFNRPFDAVPQISKNETMLEKNRLVDGDYVQDFDNVDLDVNLTVDSTFDENNQLFNEWNTVLINQIPTPAVPFDIVSGGWICTPPASGTGSDDTFGGYQIDFTNIYEAGYLWVINLEITPNVQYGSASFGYYTKEYLYKTAKGVAIIDAVPGMTLQKFLNAMIPQLRYGSTQDTLITIDQDTSMGYNLFESYTEVDGWNGVRPGSLGIVAPASAGYGFPFWQNYRLNITITQLHRGSIKLTSFKSGITHKLGLVYYDRAGRCGAVNTNLKTDLYILHDSEVLPTHQLKQNYIRWEINHKPPVWADYYQWVYAKGATMSYFIQSAIADIGVAVVSDYIYIDINEYIRDTIELMPTFSIEPYEWVQGDRLRFTLYRSGLDQFHSFTTVLDYEIVGTQICNLWEQDYEKDNNSPPDFILDSNGNKIVNNRSLRLFIKAFDYTSFNISKRNTIVEIYRPAKLMDTVLYYTIGAKLSVLNPHTNQRVHSVVQQISTNMPIPPLPWDRNQTDALSARGTLSRGDVYILTRYMMQVFPCESMSYSDFFNDQYTVKDVNYEDNAISIGLPNIVNPDIKRTEYISKLLSSGSFIQDTKTNDLSKVDSTNSVTLADKFGPINWMEEVGYILKVLQTKKPTSIPIGRVAFDQADQGKPVVGTTTLVLGVPQPHDSDYGTTHGTGVVKHEERYYFPDLYAGLILMDSDNGIHPVSLEYGIDSFFKTVCQQFLQDGIENIQVYSAYDEFYHIVFFTFTDSVQPGLNFTIGFKEGVQNIEGFISFYQFIPDFYGSAKAILTSFKNNALWLHNSDNVPRMNFYGVQFYQKLTLVFNAQPITTKDHKVIQINATEEFYAPNVGDVKIYADGTYREKQTKIPKGKFKKKEGKYYSEIPRNMLTRKLTASNSDFINGDPMRGRTIEITLSNESSDDKEITDVQVESEYSLGT